MMTTPPIPALPTPAPQPGHVVAVTPARRAAEAALFTQRPPHTEEPMLTIYPRAYVDDADLQAIVAVQAAARAHHAPMEELFTVEELRDQYNEPAFDLQRDLRLWEANGAVVMFADIWIKAADDALDGMLYYQMLPDADAEPVHRAALAWAEARLREAAAERNSLRPVLRVACAESQTDWLQWWSTLGFTVVGVGCTMQRDLHAPIDAPALPAGFTVRQLAGAHEVASWVDCYNQSFIDHPNFHPRTVDDMLHYQRTPDYRPDLDLVAVADDGTVAAFCYCSISPSINAAQERSEGWINMLGTRRGYRRRGLGRALLLTGMHALKHAGMDDAKLGADADNPSGAVPLYESVGFYRVGTWVHHAKELVS